MLVVREIQLLKAPIKTPARVRTSNSGSARKEGWIILPVVFVDFPPSLLPRFPGRRSPVRRFGRLPFMFCRRGERWQFVHPRASPIWLTTRLRKGPLAVMFLVARTRRATKNPGFGSFPVPRSCCWFGQQREARNFTFQTWFSEEIGSRGEGRVRWACGQP